MSAPESLGMAASICLERKQSFLISPSGKSPHGELWRVLVIGHNYSEARVCEKVNIAASLSRLSDEVADAGVLP